MSKFHFEWEDVVLNSIEIEALSQEEAEKKFMEGDFDFEEVEIIETYPLSERFGGRRK